MALATDERETGNLIGSDKVEGTAVYGSDNNKIGTICRPDGLSDFDALRYRRRGHNVTLVAFDLIELQADDLRDLPLEQRKQRLAKLLTRGGEAITYNEHLKHDGAL